MRPGPLPAPPGAAGRACLNWPTAVPCFWTRSARSPGDPGGAAAGPAGKRDPPGGRKPGDPCGRAHHRRHQQGSAAGDRGRPLPGGPVLPSGRAGPEAPPLRERGDDVKILGLHLFRQLPGGKDPIMQSQFLYLLEQAGPYQWYGNIRELQNFVERANILMRNAGASSRDGVGYSAPPR